jgi:hypothetical protein
MGSPKFYDTGMGDMDRSLRVMGSEVALLIWACLLVTCDRTRLPVVMVVGVVLVEVAGKEDSSTL